jgi:hypothetical protein
MKGKKGIIDKLDTTWAKLVKRNAGNQCEVCGKTTHLNAHHIYSRSKKSTRWELINGISLCVGHHVFSSKFSAHKTPLEFMDWLKEYKGEEYINALRQKANQTLKLNKAEMEELLKELESKLNNQI